MNNPMTIMSLWCLLLALTSFRIRVDVVDSFSPPMIRSGSSCHCRSRIRTSETHHDSSVCSERRRRIVATRTVSATALFDSYGGKQEPPSPPKAVLLLGSSQSTQEQERLVHALRAAGYASVEVSETTRFSYHEEGIQQSPNTELVYCYELSRATGMLKLVSSSSSGTSSHSFEAPSWVPIVRGEENVLVANGWSFLDPDESEAMSAFDIDDANAEGEYRPKWGTSHLDTIEESPSSLSSSSPNPLPQQLSPLGYDLSPLSKDDVLSQADALEAHSNPHSRGVLLHGETDPPNTKQTCNGYNFSGSAGQLDISQGIFFTAIGGLPLFSTKDLSPTTASSGWLSFARPLDASHVIHVEPPKDSSDQRIEVVCARSKCHLGHYFGPTEGYCINASALKFLPAAPTSTAATITNALSVASRPVSWRPLDQSLGQTAGQLSPSLGLLKNVLEMYGRYEAIALGCGCFWHVEEALRNLQGVVATEACYAGGHTPTKPPTYPEVCSGTTGHAEVVSVVYDPEVCPTNVLIDCFLAMHDPTMVKAHGKHARHVGQYRSCVFVESAEVETVAHQCLEDCRQQLGKELSTEIRNMRPTQQQQQPTTENAFGEGWCWRAEDEHQRHDERIKGGGRSEGPPRALAAIEWLREYGRRTPSIIGSSLESALDPDDDGMAMMMI